MPGYKIILADDHEILRAGLKSLIEKNNLFKVVGQVKDGQELLDLLKLTKCDLVVLDLSMPNMDGLTTIKEVHRKFPKVRIVVLTMQKDSEHFRHAISSRSTLGSLGPKFVRDYTTAKTQSPCWIMLDYVCPF